MAKLVNYYRRNNIDEDKYDFRLVHGINKHEIVAQETWFASDNNDQEIESALMSLNKYGAFYIRKSSNENKVLDGAVHVFTLLLYINSSSGNKIQKFGICCYVDNQIKKYLILNEEFTSLIDLVYYYKKNHISKEIKLIDPPNINDKIAAVTNKFQNSSLEEFLYKVYFNLFC